MSNVKYGMKFAKVFIATTVIFDSLWNRVIMATERVQMTDRLKSVLMSFLCLKYVYYYEIWQRSCFPGLILYVSHNGDKNNYFRDTEIGHLTAFELCHNFYLCLLP